MAYNTKERFLDPPQYYRLLDPGAYQNMNRPLIKPNKAPFLANSQRKIKSGSVIWTHAIYSSDIKPKIANCTAMMSKIPRFSYEKSDLSKLEDLLCACKDPNICECEDEDKSSQEGIICQSRRPRVLFKGAPPRSQVEDGISAPSKRDHGFAILPDGSKKRIFIMPDKECPPFYNTNINESTAFYRGCKWSRWTSKISKTCTDTTPGPAQYILEHEPTFNEICAERVRAFKRKTSKQLRFIEMVQRRNVIENLPGPSSYSPVLPKSTDLNFLGPKAARFTTSQFNICPGPAQYWVKRDFDKPEAPKKICQAILPAPAPFGVKAVRLKPLKEEGPSPASYNPAYKPCNFIRCTKAPFLISTERFKEKEPEESDDEIVIDNESLTDTKEKQDSKPTPTWQFKSIVPRMKPLTKAGPKPVAISSSNVRIKRFMKLQRAAPFFSSEGRFRPWYNWIPIHAKEKTPGPAYYDLTPPECYPAVSRGPLFRSPRFRSYYQQTPAPNEYKVVIGIENILHTHNQHLKENLQKKHKFQWQPTRKPRPLNNEEKETVLLRESIALLNTIDVTDSKSSNYVHAKHLGHENKKTLRCFADG
ncbi:uncharacterized protein LOC119835723 [Zerene cesonia]|uniref:uncharacterized protein LOC119835723 n=1 Tax=Zerene cesonia TaxID=33412 RepID=UPI0018E510AD|nr:uncharacterized protein LOC119835723 [Zerene cesonia]